VAVGAVDDFFSQLDIRYGYVAKADGNRDLPVLAQLGRYNRSVGSRLHMRLGRSETISSGNIISHCERHTNDMTLQYYGFVVVTACAVKLGQVSPWPQEGDSGSPVYDYVTSGGNVIGVAAYGVLFGRELWYGVLPTGNFYIAHFDSLPVYVKVTIQ
jgi:hypothetical protein